LGMAPGRVGSGRWAGVGGGEAGGVERVGWVFEKRSNGVASVEWALRENLYGIPGI